MTLALLRYGPATLRSGRSRVLLPENPFLAGTTLRAELEIPLSLEQAPPLVARLQLRPIEAGIGEGSSNDETIVWLEEVRIDNWQPSGSRRSRAHFSVDVPEKVQADLGADRITYSWELVTRSADPARRHGTVYLLPIAFRDPVEEGVVGPG